MLELKIQFRDGVGGALREDAVLEGVAITALAPYVSLRGCYASAALAGGEVEQRCGQ